jgi:hypothetical protein
MTDEMESELTVDTPWGKLITVKGLKFLLDGFTNDLEKINGSLRNIETRLAELESTLPSKNTISRIQALEGSFKSLEDEIQQFRENQTNFASHMKKTLELFYSRLES